jgi:FkbM family methyltransferase
MPSMGVELKARAGMYAERWVYGRQRYQPLFHRLHQIALTGLGYGEGNPEINGEYALLDRFAATWPASPTIVDVGAYQGDWTREVLRRAPAATVHALEPVPATYVQLHEALDGRAILHNTAAGDHRGEGDITGPPEHPDMASLNPRDLSTVGLSAHHIATVPVTTLDALSEQHAIDRVHLLKIDTEGHELAVLRGATGLLADQRIDAIQLETGGCDIDSRTFVRDFLDLLQPAGYRLHRLLRDGLDPIRRDERHEIFTYANLVATRERA